MQYIPFQNDASNKITCLISYKEVRRSVEVDNIHTDYEMKSNWHGIAD